MGGKGSGRKKDEKETTTIKTEEPETAPTDEEEEGEEKREAPQPYYLDRGARLDEIAEQAHKEQGLAPDEPEEGEEKPEEEVIEGEEAKSEEDEEETEEKAEAEEGEEEEKPPEVTRTIKVNGVEKQVTQAEIDAAGIAALQKESAADRRLEEATKLLKEAKTRTESTQPSTEDRDVEREGKTATATPEERAAQIANAIQYGDEEEATKAIAEVLKAAEVKGEKPPTIDEIVISIERRQFDQKFAKEFPEIATRNEDGKPKNPYLYEMTRLEADRLIQEEGLPGNEFSTYEKAADTVLDMRGMSRKKAKARESFEQKKEKKKEIDVIPTVNQKTETTIEAEPEESVSDIIQSIARARHQNP